MDVSARGAELTMSRKSAGSLVLMTENRPTGEADSTSAAAHGDALSALVASARAGV